MTILKASSLTLLIYFMILALVLRSHAQNSQTDYLNIHNSARSQVGVSEIAWNTTLQTYAQNYANQRIGDCNLVHSNGPYGENIAKGSGSFSGTSAVNLWVVWRNSIRISCARVQCSNGWWFVICSYDPPGNYIGQRPY
ncbi:unnamed protein product [Withania somnifera]